MSNNTYPHGQGIGLVSRIQDRQDLSAQLNRFVVYSPGGVLVRYRIYPLLPSDRKSRLSAPSYSTVVVSLDSST
ncbi:MAG: hypothetical protein ICV63_03595 [Coleofasciculus sp. Co-bin14]|nr:hypothetical protein [Coleofasciculus sp. Co-bin14]